RHPLSIGRGYGVREISGNRHFLKCRLSRNGIKFHHRRSSIFHQFELDGYSIRRRSRVKRLTLKRKFFVLVVMQPPQHISIVAHRLVKKSRARNHRERREDRRTLRRNSRKMLL